MVAASLSLKQRLPDMLHRLEFHAMGCEMLAVVDSEPAPLLLPKVPEWFEEWEQVLSRFRFDSELTQLNQIHEQPIHVSETLWDVFQAARKAEKMTNGLVTPALLDAIIEAGYDRPFDMLPHLATLMPDPVLTTSTSLTAIAVDNSARTITLPFGVGLDFGGVAKGWAAYQAMKRLQARPEQGRRAEGPALIDAAGDIAISGPRADGSSWQIGVADPFHRGQEIETFFVNQGGVATSGKDRRRWTRNGILQHHIIDPLTNQPAETDLLTVTVVAPDVMQAEAAAKVAFILGSRAGLEWIETRSELAALFILDNGQMYYSAKIEDYLG
jgi:FAD:protein FMN transferase